MSKQVAKSFEVKFGERVTIRASSEEWAKLEAVAKHRGQTLERLIQEAEQDRPAYILRPDWLRQVAATRSYCCKYYRDKKGTISMNTQQITLPAHAPIPAAATPHQIMSHLAENGSWHVPAVPMRELNSNEAVEFILNSKLLQATPRIDATAVKGGVYVLFNPDTKEPHLCLYNPDGKCFVFNLAKMPDSLTQLIEGLDFEFTLDSSGQVQALSKPFQSLRSQLGV